MAETTPRRRRWPWWIAGAVLLLVAGPIAWSFRPLNTVERRLLGKWRSPTSDPSISVTYTFTPDRRAVFDTGFGLPPLHGTWSASSSGLLMSFEGPAPKSWTGLPRSLLYDVRRRLNARPSPLEFLTDHEVMVASAPTMSYRWTRVAPSWPPARMRRPGGSGRSTPGIR